MTLSVGFEATRGIVVGFYLKENKTRSERISKMAYSEMVG